MGAVKTLAFRTDGNTQIGLGHIMRCLALAQGLERIGARSTFVIRDYDRKLRELIQHYGYNMEALPKGCSTEKDLRLTLEYADRYRAEIITTDLGHAGTLAHQGEYGEYLQGLKDKGKFLITIDDLSKMEFPSDIVINPNCGAANKNYYLGGSTKFLLGPAYFIFRPEFIAAARVKRQIKKEANNILITISGSDPLDLTGKVARALAKSGKTLGLNLHIVLGIDYTKSRTRNLNKTLVNYRGNYELIQGSGSMAELMLRSDLAITGAGLTKYEAAVTGTPVIIIPQYAHLVELAEEFARKGVALNLGLGDKIKEEDIAWAVAKLLGDATLRAEMSRMGRKLVDGKGIERIIAEIPQEVWS